MSKLTTVRRAARRFARKLRREEGGLALIEFAFTAPIVVTISMYGLELSNFALANLRVSQIASNLADTTSRVGELTPLALKQIREVDINDALQAARIQGEPLRFMDRGRAILTSLEQNEDGGQWIRWQRCIGDGDFEPTYGQEGRGEEGQAFPGMGPEDEEVQAPDGTAVMFVEVFYEYDPIVNSALLGPRVIRPEAAFLVRDRRDYEEGSNPANPEPDAVASNCD